MDHHHPPSYLSVVLRPQKWDHAEKRRHGYALNVHYELLYIYSVLSSVSLSHGLQAICTLRTL